jgi:hypothetical protein
MWFMIHHVSKCVFFQKYFQLHLFFKYKMTHNFKFKIKSKKFLILHFDKYNVYT